MNKMVLTLGIVSSLLLNIRGLQADDAQQAVGSEIELFTLRPINTEKSGKRLVVIEDYFGDGENKSKAVMISFFATYCKPCKKDLPFLQALWETYKDRGFNAFVISIDREKEKLDEIKGLIDEHGLTYPVLWDRFNIVARRYYSGNQIHLPCSYLVGPDMRISMVNTQYDEGTPKKLLMAVRELLGIPLDDPIEPKIKEHMGAEAAVGSTEDASMDDDTAASAEGSTEEAASDDVSAEAAASDSAEEQSTEPSAPSFTDKQKKVIEFAQKWIETLEQKCAKPVLCVRAFKGLARQRSRRIRRVYRQLQRSGGVTDELTGKLKDLQSRRDEMISQKKPLARNRHLRRIVKRMDKAIGM